MDKRCPRGGESTSWAWTVEHQDAGAGRQTKLLVSAVPVGTWMEINTDRGDSRPQDEPEELGANFPECIGLKKFHGIVKYLEWSTGTIGLKVLRYEVIR